MSCLQSCLCKTKMQQTELGIVGKCEEGTVLQYGVLICHLFHDNFFKDITTLLQFYMVVI